MHRCRHCDRHHPQARAVAATSRWIVHALLFALLFLACLLTGARIALAQPSETSSCNDKDTLILVVENDKFGGGTDQHYSNGLMLTWVSPDFSEWEDDSRLPRLLTGYGEYAPFVNGGKRRRSVSLSLGHAIYTPVDVKTENLVEDDRPYAGWLFLSMGLHSKNTKVLDIFETTIGVVGPSALGKQVQNNFHNFIGVERSEGWDNQIKDEPGLMFTWQRSRRWVLEQPGQGWGLDFIPHLGATVGNVFTHANLGGEIRAGWNLPNNFGSSLIGPAKGVSAPSANPDDDGLGLHVFAGADGRAVARNIFLDGNTWQKSHSVDKKTLVADLFAGVSLHWKGYAITFTQAARTQEFKGQDSTHVFGSLMLSAAF